MAEFSTFWDIPGMKSGVITGDVAWNLLRFAKATGFAIPAFNCTTSSSVNSVLEAGAAIGRPVMIQFSEGGSAFFAGKGLSNADKSASILGAVAGAHYTRNVSPAYGIPCLVHSDHCAKKLLPWFDGMLQADELYFKVKKEPLFSSHMLDLSEEPHDENVGTCAEYFKRMAPMNLILEMEIGITGGVEDGVDNSGVSSDKLYSTREDVKLVWDTLLPISPKFTIAAAFGNVHGVYKPGNVKLQPELLDDFQKDLGQKLGVDKPYFFVFHGGSGSEKKDIDNAVSYGVVKMNVDTDTQWAYWEGILKFYKKSSGYLQGQIGNPEGSDKPNKNYYDPRKWVREAEITMRDRVKESCTDLKNCEATKAEILCKKLCEGLPQDRDLANPRQPEQVRRLAEEIIASEVSPADLKALTFPNSKKWPVIFLTAILAAESALKLKECPPHHHTIIHAMYGEQDRMKTTAENPDGQDFVRVKVASMNWLYGKYAAAGSSWNYIAVDDGCPNNPPSGQLMEAVIKKEGYTNVEVVYLQTGIDQKTPPFDQLKATKDSRKGGSILYGLHCVVKMPSPGKKHIASFYDADLSADLALIGLLAHPIMVEGKKCGVGQRYGCPGSFLALPEGANGHPQSLYKNTDCFRMMFRHFARGILMPSLKGIYDTQCAFKSIEVDKLGEIVGQINEFGAGFDMELLIRTGKTYGGDPFKLVPFLFIEDKEGSTMSSTDEAASKSFHTMLKAMVKIHERCFADAALTDDDKAWIQFFRDVDLDSYKKMIAANTTRLGPTPPDALDTKYDLKAIKSLLVGLSEQDLVSEPYRQEHLFKGASAEEKASYVAQMSNVDSVLPGGGLKGYLTRGRALLADAKSGKNPFTGLTPTLPSGTKLSGVSGPGSAAYADLEKLGMANLSKCTFCLVAGGLGERLGYPGIKIGITAEVTTGVTFIETYARSILAYQAYARKATGDGALILPLAVMTSGDTHAMTMDIFAKNKNFGLVPEQLIIMQQENVPALMDVDARIAGKGGKIETKPHGHGDVHALLLQRGLPKKWVGEGKEWLFVFQDTNPLPFRSLCAIIGVSAKENFVMNSVTVPRIPGEAVGGICTLVNEKSGSKLTINVEYNQLEPLLKETPVGGDVADASGFLSYPGNINVLVFKLQPYGRCLETTGGIVPEFVNPKWADSEKSKFKSATRLECMMQDFPKLCGPDDKLGFVQLDRDMCFTCVKNALADAAKKNPPDCALSAEADIYACNARLLKLAGEDVVIEEAESVSFLGISAKIGARIILQPSFGVSLEAMKGKIKGKVRISKRSTLVVDGDITIDGLDLDGALTLRGSGVIRNLSVKNAGRPLVAIAEAELPSVGPSFQIRGYQVSRAGELEEKTVS